NHTDPKLMSETTQTAATLGTLASFLPGLAQITDPRTGQPYSDRITLATMNVFGRTLSQSYYQQTDGRGHNQSHHVSVMIGKPFAPSLIGGVEAAVTYPGGPPSGDFAAQSIDSTSGAGVAKGGGDVPWNQSLQSAALTLGVGLGVDPNYLASNVTGGKVIDAAFA
ncbi:MAG: hypothetical protein ACYCWW_17200, partial [Deltaproteobacteria bacterium]